MEVVQPLPSLDTRAIGLLANMLIMELFPAPVCPNMTMLRVIVLSTWMDLLNFSRKCSDTYCSPLSLCNVSHDLVLFVEFLDTMNRSIVLVSKTTVKGVLRAASTR